MSPAGGSEPPGRVRGWSWAASGPSWLSASTSWSATPPKSCAPTPPTPRSSSWWGRPTTTPSPRTTPSWPGRWSPRSLARWWPPARPSTGFSVLLGVVTVILALFLSFARIYVGAHYPGDVVAGLLLGGVVVGVVSLLRPVAYWITEQLEPTLLGALVRRPAIGQAQNPAAIGVRQRTPAS